jgi:hypothetical protein
MSDLELFYRSNECDIFFNNNLKVVQQEWKGIFASGIPLRMVCEKTIELFELKKVSAIVVDAREMKIITKEDQHWIVTDWHARALQAGLRYEALVVTRDSFNELSIKKIIQHYDANELKTKYFTNMENAFEWVRNGFDWVASEI